MRRSYWDLRGRASRGTPKTLESEQRVACAALSGRMTPATLQVPPQVGRHKLLEVPDVGGGDRQTRAVHASGAELGRLDDVDVKFLRVGGGRASPPGLG